jgi:5,10-methylene-tetrahydrofolate dehydrogenase/methenyl tetrahydrofolate cyclohydrolase
MKKLNAAKIIDGSAIAKQIRNEIKEEFERFQKKNGKDMKPGLAAIIVGDRKDSLSYVNMKKKIACEIGFESFIRKFDDAVTQEELMRCIREFNENDRVHGILVQLPLPKHIKEVQVLDAIAFTKDVDGFNPLNIGSLGYRDRTPLYVPCTPKGCVELLDRCNIKIEGKNVVIIGRSKIVGLPLSMLLLSRNATITICHSHTENIQEKIKQADIVVSACGKPEFIRGEWIKPGAVVIDVGINAIEDKNEKRGYKLVGDVCFEEAKQVASFITPVPGGVGPMTVAMLMKNTWLSFLRSIGVNSCDEVKCDRGSLHCTDLDFHLQH